MPSRDAREGASFGPPPRVSSPSAAARPGLIPSAHLAHDLVRERRVGRVDAAEARVAEQALHPRRGEDPEAAGQLERRVGHLPRALDGPVLGRDDLERPGHAVVDAVRPVVGQSIEVRADRLDLHHHLGDPCWTSG